MKRATHELSKRTPTGRSLIPDILPLAKKASIRAVGGHTQPILGTAVMPVRIGCDKQTIDSDIYLQRFAILDNIQYDVI